MAKRKWQPRGANAPKFPDLPPELLHVVFHTLGIEERRPGWWRVGGWRNHYCACDGDMNCERLDKLGWLRWRDPMIPGSFRVYYVTDAGKQALRALGWVVGE